MKENKVYIDHDTKMKSNLAPSITVMLTSYPGRGVPQQLHSVTSVDISRGWRTNLRIKNNKKTMR